jgi:hypothetical protein
MGYKTYISSRGWQLLGDLIAAANSEAEAPTLQFSRVKFGEGAPPSGVSQETLEDLVAYVADGTSTIPTVAPYYHPDGSVEKVVVSFVVEYCSAKNGADQIDRVWHLSEFSTMTLDPVTGEEFSFLRGDLSDFPMVITPFSQGAIDVRQFQCSFVISKELQVELLFVPLAWLTSQDMEDRLAAHNADPQANPAAIAEHDNSPTAHDEKFAELWALIQELFGNSGTGGTYFTCDLAGLTDGTIIDGTHVPAIHGIEAGVKPS